MNSLSLVSSLSLSLSFFAVNSQVFCDNDYNVSSCADTTLSSANIYKCRGFMSCKDSAVSNSKDLYCQGDRSCKNVDYDNDDDDELWAFGYRSADSLTMSNEANDAYCYGYQSCIDIVYSQSDSGNDAEAHGYQSMYGAYIDYSNAVDANGYQGLYEATIDTTSVKDDEIDITINGYYGSVETDIMCQDGMTCNFYAYGWYATDETYLYCLGGATCNVYCGDNNGCIGMNLYCYSTATCYFDCDDASECPNEEDAQATSKLLSYTKTAQEMDNEFEKFRNDRLAKKQEKQHEFKQERLREERKEMAAINFENEMKKKSEWQYTLVQSMIVLLIGIFIGVMTTYGYNKCVTNKAFSYQSIV